VQSEQREPTLQDDGELLLDRRLQRFLSKRRRLARVRWWGTFAAVTLIILVVAVVLFGAWLGRGHNGSNGEPGLQQLAPGTSEAPDTSEVPATSEAPATSGASQPSAVTESPSTLVEAPAQPLGQPPLPTHVQSLPLKVEAGSTLGGESGRGATASPRQEAAVDSVQVMARSLIAKLGRERAEEAARTNASWYAPGSGTFLYWQRVANAIRTAKRGVKSIP
jgi:hypothetical protein